MARQPNRYGGGARTNANGLYFEQTISLNAALLDAGYQIRKCDVFFRGKHIGVSVPQRKIYSDFLVPNNIDYRDYNSKEWHPEEAFINFTNDTAYIIEKNSRIHQDQ